MTGPRVLTVILNWRTPDMTLRAVQAARLAMEGLDGTITVVDNASGDGSEDALRTGTRDMADVRVIQSGRNGGYGAGNNAGIRAGLPGGQRPDYIYILNSDAFPAPDAIRALVSHLETHPKTGFVGSHMHGPEGDPHRTAFRFPSIAGEFEAQVRFGPVSRLLRNWIVAQPLPTVSTRVDWLAGASLMMRMDVLDRIGLFDETFFLYFEETELCRRAAAAGWPIDYVVTSRVAHIGSVSTGMKECRRMPAYWFDSRWHYFTKVHGRAYAIAATLAALSGGALWRLRLLVQQRDRGDPPHFLRDMARHHLRAILSPKTPAKAGQPTRPAE